MKTKIELLPPYSNDWKKGYLNINSEGRKTVTLFNSNADRSSTSYARYLMSVELGRYLTSDEEVDHIDEDKSNDDISNLQILTKKQHKNKNVILIEGFCYVCGDKIVKRKSDLRPKSKHTDLKNNLLCCSRECGYIKARETYKNRKNT